jgi:hypothetical protein
MELFPTRIPIPGHESSPGSGQHLDRPAGVTGLCLGSLERGEITQELFLPTGRQTLPARSSSRVPCQTSLKP